MIEKKIRIFLDSRATHVPILKTFYKIDHTQDT